MNTIAQVADHLGIDITTELKELADIGTVRTKFTNAENDVENILKDMPKRLANAGPDEFESVIDAAVDLIPRREVFKILRHHRALTMLTDRETAAKEAAIDALWVKSRPLVQKFGTELAALHEKTSNHLGDADWCARNGRSKEYVRGIEILDTLNSIATLRRTNSPIYVLAAPPEVRPVPWDQEYPAENLSVIEVNRTKNLGDQLRLVVTLPGWELKTAANRAEFEARVHAASLAENRLQPEIKRGPRMSAIQA